MGPTHSDLDFPDTNRPDRPHHEGALNSADLVPGLWIDVIGDHPGALELMRYVVLEALAPDPKWPGLWVKVIAEDVARDIGAGNLSRYQGVSPDDELGTGIIQVLSAHDMGTESDANGTWNTWYHTERSAEQLQTDLG